MLGNIEFERAFNPNARSNSSSAMAERPGQMLDRAVRFGRLDLGELLGRIGQPTRSTAQAYPINGTGSSRSTSIGARGPDEGTAADLKYS